MSSEKNIQKIVAEVNALFAEGPPKKVAWRMPSKCADCPFKESGPGLHLRKSLGPGRWQGILDALKEGQYFNCHQTTSMESDDDGDPLPTGTELVCAGAIEWQDKHGCSSAYVRICRRLDEARKQEREKKQHGKRP